MEPLLGPHVLTKSGEKLSVAELSSRASVVGLYFSAHWCGPCRAFTPALADSYSKTLKGKGLEIVFVSSDKDEGAFGEYYGSMPWLALPYEDRARKAKLSSKFKVQGIPTLVLLDAKTGEVISSDGRMNVMRDPAGESFPWRPAPLTDSLNKMRILADAKDTAPKPFAEAVKADVVAVYVSASWCGPCRQVTPMLAKIYDAIRKEDVEAGRGAAPRLEVVLVSEDEDEASFRSYFAKMPWKALDFRASDVKEELVERFQVQGIPRLVLIDGKTGRVLVEDAVGVVVSDPEGYPWLPKPVTLLTEGNGSVLSDGPSVVVFAKTPAEAKDFQTRFIPVVEGWRAASAPGSDDYAVIAAGPNRLTDRVKGIIKSPDAVLVAVDLQEGRVAVDADVKSVGDVTPDRLAAFLAKLSGGQIEFASLE